MFSLNALWFCFLCLERPALLHPGSSTSTLPVSSARHFLYEHIPGSYTCVHTHLSIWSQSLALFTAPLLLFYGFNNSPVSLSILNRSCWFKLFSFQLVSVFLKFHKDQFVSLGLPYSCCWFPKHV